MSVRLKAPSTVVDPDFDMQAVARFILVDNYMHRISSYMARGRGFEMINDIEAELDLRHVQRPFAVGQKEIEKIRLATLAFGEKLDDGSRLAKEAELVERYRSARKTMS
jgi:hypothetical protein